ncbi:DUF296 domain-containing protein [Streptomyces sp. NPDC051985]|uniref:PCC domain-containing protein n=1 Tax=Streptomyces sp. NPDC051985 TaxID=3155807 RepID=UPI00341385AE
MTPTSPLTGPIRPLVHPGTPHPVRRIEAPTTTAAFHTTIPAHTPVIEAFSSVVDRAGHGSAQLELTGGTFERVSYCVPDACPDGETAMRYSTTREAVTPAQLLSGSVTVGHRDGARFTHSHATWLDADGRLRAGHLWPDSVTGAVPISAIVYPLPGVNMINSRDAETWMPTFAPQTGTVPPASGTGRRAVICRVLPGEDVTTVVESVCRERGFTHAEVRASLGSFVGAALKGRHATRYLDGPATEVISLTGTVTCHAAGEPRAALSAVIVDLHGAVHAGELVPGENLIAVTFELLVLEGARS